MNRVRTRWCLLAVTGCLVLYTCGSRYQGVENVKGTTVPPGDTAPPLSDPVTEPLSLKFGSGITPSFVRTIQSGETINETRM
jgi:hypothetical protein